LAWELENDQTEKDTFTASRNHHPLACQPPPALPALARGAACPCPPTTRATGRALRPVTAPHGFTRGSRTAAGHGDRSGSRSRHRRPRPNRPPSRPSTGRASRRRRPGALPTRAACRPSPSRPPRRRVRPTPGSLRVEPPAPTAQGWRRSVERSPLTKPPPSVGARRPRHPAACPTAAAGRTVGRRRPPLAGAMDDGTRRGGVHPAALVSCGARGRRRPRGDGRRFGPPRVGGWRRRGGEPRARDGSADGGGGLRATGTPVECTGADAKGSCLWRRASRLGARRSARAGGRGAALPRPPLAAR